MEKKKVKNKLVRIISGVLLLTLGAIFLIFPFIPLGYLFILIGLFTLSPLVPFFRREIDKLSRKDKRFRLLKIKNKLKIN
jgi:hypothetical protein